MEVYDRIAKVVAPKKIALAAAESELSVQMEKLNAKRAELKIVSINNSTCKNELLYVCVCMWYVCVCVLL